LVDTLGEERIVVGSDYPYPLGERPVGRVVREATFLTPAQRAKLLSANALRFLGSAVAPTSAPPPAPPASEAPPAPPTVPPARPSSPPAPPPAPAGRPRP